MSIFKLDINYKSVLILVVSAFVLVMMYRIQSIISVFAFSFFAAYLLDPVIDRMEAAGIPRTIGILILLLILSLAVALFVLSLFPLLYSEAKYLVDNAPKTISSLADVIQKIADRMNVSISFENLKNQIAPKTAEIAQNVFSALGSALSSATSAVSAVINLAVVPILIFYFLKDFDIMSGKLFHVLEKKTNRDYKKYVTDFNRILAVYFRGQIVVALILTVLYTSVLLISGVKPAILIGLVSGVLSIVPYLGFMIGFVTSIVLAVVQYQDFLHPLMVVAGFAVVQVLEGNFITPKIVGDSLGLHPTAVIFALLAGGSLFGIGGMILALPIAAFIKIIINEQLA